MWCFILHCILQCILQYKDIKLNNCLLLSDDGNVIYHQVSNTHFSLFASYGLDIFVMIQVTVRIKYKDFFFINTLILSKLSVNRFTWYPIPILLSVIQARLHKSHFNLTLSEMSTIINWCLNSNEICATLPSHEVSKSNS